MTDSFSRRNMGANVFDGLSSFSNTSGTEQPSLSVVIPVYKNEANIPQLIARLKLLAVDFHAPLEAVCVVDGIVDNCTLLLLAHLKDTPIHWQVIVLSRNFGSFNAIRIGLERSHGELLVVMSADLQEPVEFLLEAYSELASGKAEIVAGRRTDREDPFPTKYLSNVYWFFYRKFVMPSVPRGGIDVFGCTRQVAQTLSAFKESNTSLVGLLYWTGFPLSEVPYNRISRLEGESSWSLRKKFRYMSDSIYSFTNLPIVLIQVLGLFGFLVTTGFSFILIILWSVGLISVPGYTPIILMIAFATFVILGAVSILGSFIWRIYSAVQGRPFALVSKVHARTDGANGRDE